MAIKWARLKPGKGSGVGDGGQQEFRTSYTVCSDIPNENRSAILASGIIPVYGAPHPENANAVCIRVSVDQNKDNPFLWDATAEWKVNPPSKRDPADQQKQPDLRRERWSLRTTPEPFAIYCDLDGKLLASSAGQPFDPVVQVPMTIDEITIERYETECHRVTQRGYINKVNSVTFFGAEAGTALMRDIAVVDEYIQGRYWFRTTYSIAIKPFMSVELPHETEVTIGGWDPETIADVGTLQLATVDGVTKLVPITRTDPITKKPFYDGRPAFLDGAGKELARDSSGIYTVDPVFTQFHLRPRVSFATLNFDPPEGLTGT